MNSIAVLSDLVALATVTTERQPAMRLTRKIASATNSMTKAVMPMKKVMTATPLA
jgi:hypothetical protein